MGVPISMGIETASEVTFVVAFPPKDFTVSRKKRRFLRTFLKTEQIKLSFMVAYPDQGSSLRNNMYGIIVYNY